jgi:YbbR domain-containing protein
MSREARFKPFENKGLKLTALLLALLSWMAIQEITSYEQRFLNIPVRVQHDIGMSVQDTNPQTLDVRLRGTRSEILALNERDLRIEIDLRGQPFEEDLLIDVTEKQVIFPGGARVVDVEPSAVHLRMDQSISRRAVVIPETKGVVQDGYTLESITSEPEWVTLRGSQRLVGAVERVLTQAIDLGGKVQSFESRVRLVPPSPNWPARMEPESVLVRVDIAESFVERVIPNIPLHVMRNPGDFTPLKLSHESVTLTIKGNPDVLEKLSVGDLQAYVRTGSLKLGEEITRPVLLDVPTRVRMVSVEPSKISMQQLPPEKPVAVAVPDEPAVEAVDPAESPVSEEPSP